MREPSDRPRRVRATWRNWAGDQRCTPARCAAPASSRSSSAAVGARRRDGLRVRGSAPGTRSATSRCTDGRCSARADEPRPRRRPRDRRWSRVQAGHHDPRAEPAARRRTGLAMENLGDIDVQTHRRRDLDGHARHGRAAAQHLLAGRRADARARRRLDARAARESATRTSSAPRASGSARWA